MRIHAFFTVGLLAFVGLATTGCQSACDVIVDKINECAAEGTPEQTANPNCDDDLFDCQADCYEAASCGEINGTEMGDFNSCIQACAGS